jgi:hypothetical protein
LEAALRVPYPTLSPTPTEEAELAFMTPMLLGTFSQQHRKREKIVPGDSYDQSIPSHNVEAFFVKALHAEDLEKAFYFLRVTCLPFEKPSHCRRPNRKSTRTGI